MLINQISGVLVVTRSLGRKWLGCPQKARCLWVGAVCAGEEARLRFYFRTEKQWGRVRGQSQTERLSFPSYVCVWFTTYSFSKLALAFMIPWRRGSRHDHGRWSVTTSFLVSVWNGSRSLRHNNTKDRLRMKHVRFRLLPCNSKQFKVFIGECWPLLFIFETFGSAPKTLLSEHASSFRPNCGSVSWLWGIWQLIWSCQQLQIQPQTLWQLVLAALNGCKCNLHLLPNTTLMLMPPQFSPAALVLFRRAMVLSDVCF